jgi:transcriptional regulator with XRE-family HTH domain
MVLIDRAGDEMTAVLVPVPPVCSPFVASNPSPEIGRRLRAKRENTSGTGPRGYMTAEEAADYFGVHQSTYSRWEAGDFTPQSGPRFHKVARWLGMTDEELARLKHPEVGEPLSSVELADRVRRLEVERERNLVRMADLESALEKLARRQAEFMDRVAREVSRRSAGVADGN